MASTPGTIAYKAVPAILLGSLVFVAVLYLGSHDPEFLRDIRDSLSGTSAMADGGELSAQQKERKRHRRIDQLLISDRNKRDLKEGRPFWSAPPALVDLAFGSTAENTSISVRNGTSFEFYEYLVGGTQRVAAEFQDGRLSCIHYAKDHNVICDTQRDSFYAHSQYPFDQPAARR